MVAEFCGGEGRKTNEEEDRKMKGGERNYKAIYTFFSSRSNYHFNLAFELNSLHVLYLAATQCLCGSHISPKVASFCVQIAPVSGSQVFPASRVPFSKHRQTIYQNAQNYLLIIVLILVYPNFHLHKNR